MWFDSHHPRVDSSTRLREYRSSLIGILTHSCRSNMVHNERTIKSIPKIIKNGIKMSCCVIWIRCSFRGFWKTCWQIDYKRNENKCEKLQSIYPLVLHLQCKNSHRRRLNSTQFNSIQFNSIQFKSNQVKSNQIKSIQFQSNHIKSNQFKFASI